MKGTGFRVAIVGTGMAAEPHALALLSLSDRIEVSGVYSRTRANREAFAHRFGFRAAESVEELAADRDIDAVILLTPPGGRLELVRLFASSDKHVLAEKPLGRTPDSAREIIATCARHRVKLGIVFQHRFRPASRQLTEMLQAGELGEIKLVRAEIPWWRDQSYYDEPGRGTLARDGGGVLISQAIHTLDLLLSLAGPVVEVRALAATTDLHRMETEDFAVAGVRFKNGAPGSILATTASWPGGTESIILDCTRGSARLMANRLTVHWRDGRVATFGEDTGSGGSADPMDFPFDWHKALIESFVDRVQAGADPLVTGLHSLQVQLLIEAVLQASDAGGVKSPGLH